MTSDYCTEQCNQRLAEAGGYMETSSNIDDLFLRADFWLVMDNQLDEHLWVSRPQYLTLW